MHTNFCFHADSNGQFIDLHLNQRICEPVLLVFAETLHLLVSAVQEHPTRRPGKQADGATQANRFLFQSSGGSSNSASNALRFTRPTSSSGCAAMIAAANQAVSAHQSAPTILIPEPSSGDVKTTSTTNGEWNSPSPEADERRGFSRKVSDSSAPKKRLK